MDLEKTATIELEVGGITFTGLNGQNEDANVDREEMKEILRLCDKQGIFDSPQGKKRVTEVGYDAVQRVYLGDHFPNSDGNGGLVFTYQEYLRMGSKNTISADYKASFH